MNLLDIEWKMLLPIYLFHIKFGCSHWDGNGAHCNQSKAFELP